MVKKNKMVRLASPDEVLDTHQKLLEGIQAILAEEPMNVCMDVLTTLIIQGSVILNIDKSMLLARIDQAYTLVQDAMEKDGIIPGDIENGEGLN